MPEVSGCRIDRTLHTHFHSLVHFHLQAGHATVPNAAWHDPVIVAQIGSDVQGEAMRRNALRYMHANRRKLLLANLWPSTIGVLTAAKRPDSRALRNALGHHAKVRAGADQRLFKKPDEVHRPEIWTSLTGKIASQIEDRIADQLARPVIRHVAASIHSVQLDAFA